ncbi:hypothetical protein J3458_007066 [Metarhizium acridum]|uniref:uncharacterized protein n=1 Tax=Metarhizium acridum TaxID=92637 RepID=UPI001C6CC81F|nr:hypothetical protein J3458_007066 [Metarhizium acridum]
MQNSPPDPSQDPLERPSSGLRRILDLGCGWGVLTPHLAKIFPERRCIDAINISQQQLDYCAEKLPPELRSRVDLYLCNAQDVDRLPDPIEPYDLYLDADVNAPASAASERLDELGTGDHKSPQYYTSVLKKHGFRIQDLRVLPSNAEFIHWFRVLRLNIEADFPTVFPCR